ncbi:hypothetical protein [Edwardsiella tarda]|uniref:hypothetical protein n=1 Tax=Edwardsiella tarda TaxID=636 RepID=UPI00351C0D21
MKVTVRNEAHHTVELANLSDEAQVGLSHAILIAAKHGLKRLSLCCAVAIVLVSFISWLAFKAGWTVDSTDGTSPSGLKPYTDALTGCQYLSAGGNGITPRMDVNGHQICMKESGR